MYRKKQNAIKSGAGLSNDVIFVGQLNYEIGYYIWKQQTSEPFIGIKKQNTCNPLCKVEYM